MRLLHQDMRVVVSRTHVKCVVLDYPILVGFEDSKNEEKNKSDQNL